MTIRSIFRRPSPIALMLGIILMAVSFTPTLIPRLWTYQTAISTLFAICGYALGAFIGSLWRYLELPGIRQTYQRWAVLVALGGSAVMLCNFAYQTLAWRNALHQWVEMEPVDSVHTLR